MSPCVGAFSEAARVFRDFDITQVREFDVCRRYTSSILGECFSGLRRRFLELEECPMTRDSFTSCFVIDDKMYHRSSHRIPKSVIE